MKRDLLHFIKNANGPDRAPAVLPEALTEDRKYLYADDVEEDDYVALPENEASAP